MKKIGYFKQTTRTLLSEAEKQETLEAIQRGLSYLVYMNKFWKYETDNYLRDGITALYHLRRQNKYLSTCFKLLKGYVKPKTIYRLRRIHQIETLSKIISDETGANYTEVKGLFLLLMDQFLNLTYLRK